MDRFKVLGEIALAILRFALPFCNARAREVVGTLLSVSAVLVWIVVSTWQTFAGGPLPVAPDVAQAAAAPEVLDMSAPDAQEVYDVAE